MLVCSSDELYGNLWKTYLLSRGKNDAYYDEDDIIDDDDIYEKW